MALVFVASVSFPLFQGEIDPWSLKMMSEDVLEKECLEVTHAVSTLFSLLRGSGWVFLSHIL